MKGLKFIIAICLLFPCMVGTQTAWGLLLAAARSEAGILLPRPALALLAGFLLWTVLFALFPRPLRSYIFAHEMTHALWAVLMGASVSKLRVRSDHGSVTLSKTNFLITLAPYFFPLYTVVVIMAYYTLSLFVAVDVYQWLWLSLVGFTWAFHLTFTINALLQHQTDIQQQGQLFSYTVIYLANLVGICVWVILITPATFQDAASLLVSHGKQAATILSRILAPYARHVLEQLQAWLPA